MKKLSILFVSILTLGLTAVSCSSDDDKDSGIHLTKKNRDYWHEKKLLHLTSYPYFFLGCSTNEKNSLKKVQIIIMQ